MLFYTVGQSRIFLTMLYTGLLTGAYVSLDCALRQLFEAGRLLTFAMDLLLGAGAALIITFGLVLAADGELRLYSLLGTLCGFLIYMGTIHPLLMNIFRAACRLLQAFGKKLIRIRLIKNFLK